jgi:hypothetical protein
MFIYPKNLSTFFYSADKSFGHEGKKMQQMYFFEETPYIAADYLLASFLYTNGLILDFAYL